VVLNLLDVVLGEHGGGVPHLGPTAGLRRGGGGGEGTAGAGSDEPTMIPIGERRERVTGPPIWTGRSHQTQWRTVVYGLGRLGQTQ
jgi:hypothetical protein